MSVNVIKSTRNPVLNCLAYFDCAKQFSSIYT